MSWIISAMPSITCARVNTCAPACIRSATVAAVARALDDEIGDDGDRLGMVELDATLEPSPRHHGRHRNQKLVLFAGRQIHA